MLERLGVLAVTPRNLFSEDAVLFARASAHLIDEEDGNVPKRNEFEAAEIAFGNVGVTFFAALWAKGQTVFTRDDFDVDVLEFVSCFM